MRMQQIKHGGRRPRPSSAPTIIAAMLCVVALVTAGTAWWMLRPSKDTLEHLAQPQSSSSTLNRDKAPTPKPQKSQERQKAAGDSPRPRRAAPSPR